MTYFNDSAYLTSILIPTRRRIGRCIDAIASFRRMAINPDSVQFVIKIDDDDAESIARRQELIARGHTTVLTTPRRHGYMSMHEHYNAMAGVAAGGWLWVMNDDVECLTHGWDVKLRTLDPRSQQQFKGSNLVAIAHPCDDTGKIHPIFPIVRRESFEAAGVMSAFPYVDMWLADVYGKLGAVAHLHDVRILHRDNVADAAQAEARRQQGERLPGVIYHDDFNLPEHAQVRQDVTGRLRRLLKA